MWPATDGLGLNSVWFKSGFICIKRHWEEKCCQILMDHDRKNHSPWKYKYLFSLMIPFSYQCQDLENWNVLWLVSYSLYRKNLSIIPCISRSSVYSLPSSPSPKEEGTKLALHPFFSLRRWGCILINIVCKWNVTPFNVRALWEMSIEMSSGCRDVGPEGLMSSMVQ